MSFMEISNLSTMQQELQYHCVMVFCHHLIREIVIVLSGADNFNVIFITKCSLLRTREPVFSTLGIIIVHYRRCPLL